MAATMAASNTHRSAAIVTPRSTVVPLMTLSSPRVRVNPACVPSPAEVKKEAADKQAARQQRCRSRDDEKPRRPSPQVRRRQRDGEAREVSPEMKRRRESASHHRDVSRGSSSGRPYRRDRDDAYRAAKKQESERDRDRARVDVTRKSVSGAASRPEQRARAGRPFFAAQPPAAVDGRKPTPEKVKTAEDEAEVKRRMLDIQRQREEARRAMEEMVKTVEFNDPYISPKDVLKAL